MAEFSLAAAEFTNSKDTIKVDMGSKDSIRIPLVIN